MNKQNLWFITLFSLVLVLSVYYVTMPNDMLLSEDLNDDNSSISVSVSDVGTINNLKLNKESNRSNERDGYEKILTSNESSIDEKNEAMDKMKLIEEMSVKEEKLEKKIKDKFKLDCCVEINNSIILSTCTSKSHDTKLANNIMRSIQEEFNSGKSITVKFEKK